jgi:hypothetical protein
MRAVVAKRAATTVTVSVKTVRKMMTYVHGEGAETLGAKEEGDARNTHVRMMAPGTSITVLSVAV